MKRERNRVAAAKCRNRRRELLERLEKVRMAALKKLVICVRAVANATSDE